MRDVRAIVARFLKDLRRIDSGHTDFAGPDRPSGYRAAHLRLLPQPGGQTSTTARTLTSINGHRDVPRHLPPYLTVAEVAGMLREAQATVYRLVHAGQLPDLRAGRSVRVSRNAAQRYLRDAALGDSQT